MWQANIKPQIRLGPIVATGGAERVVLPFQRSIKGLLIVAIFAIIMTVPAVSVFGDAATGWADLNTLFDLVDALFSSAWLLGWSVGLVVLWGMFVALLVGGETLIVRPGLLELYLGLPLIAVGARLDPARICNLRMEHPEANSGKSWRGPHLLFDYGDSQVEFGSNIDEQGRRELTRILEAAVGGPVPAGVAVADQQRPPDSAPSVESEPVFVRNAPPAVRSTTLASPSTLALIIANLVPVVAALLFSVHLRLVRNRS